MISIEELLVPVTTEEQLESFLATLETLGVPARSWRPAGSLRTMLRVVAAAYAGFSESVLGFVRAGFLEEATGGWLTRLAHYVYAVDRIEGTFATGSVTLTNAGGGIYVLNPGELRVLGLEGKAYTNLALVNLNPGNVLAVSVRAVELGSASNAAPGTVIAFETSLAGVTVTNPSAIVGSDEEKDADLRARCLARLAVISGLGPRGAYAFAVRSAVRGDGSAVDVNRLRVSPSSSTGVVTVWVASASGAPVPTDLPFIVAAIETYARPDTATVDVISATAVPLANSITVWARSTPGLVAADLEALVSDALLTMISAYPIGGIAKPPSTQGYLYADGIAGTAKSAHVSIFDVDGVGADIAMSPGDVVTLATTIDVRIVEVST